MCLFCRINANKGDYEMEILLPILAFGTLLAFAGFGLYSQIRTQKLKDDPNSPKSTLASDTPDH
jgi:hypothetical protein